MTYQATLMVLAGVLAFGAASTIPTACPNSLSSADFTELYCSSGLVFRGYTTWRSSSLSYTPDLTRMSYTFATFNATDVFVHNVDATDASAIDVFRIWSDSDPCPQRPFPRNREGLLVFANWNAAELEFELAPCGRVFAWECVPQSVRDALPLQC